MPKRLLLILATPIVAFLFMACSPAAPDANTVGTAIAQTLAAQPTAVVVIVTDPVPTFPPTTPTRSGPRPTATRPAENTQRPTFTPGPPTATPEPLNITGTGDSVIDVPDMCPCVIYLKGNAGRSHFAVKSFDARGEQVDLLVNTTDPYEGYRPMDWFEDENTTRLQVTARGEWQLTIVNLSQYTRSFNAPGTLTGNGDDVIILRGADPSSAKIKGNANARHFSITAWSRSGRDLLVNTVDVYEGTVIVSSDTLALEVKAEGEWTIEIK